jgi:hypothetical protein
MSKSQPIIYKDCTIWAYDVVLGIFLKHLIDTAEPRSHELENQWLVEEIAQWRIASLYDYCLHIRESWSPKQFDTFLDLLNQACRTIAEREWFFADEIQSWNILDGTSIYPRGDSRIFTAPIVNLGKAIIALANGTLAEAPAGTAWFYGTEIAPTTIPFGPG